MDWMGWPGVEKTDPDHVPVSSGLSPDLSTLRSLDADLGRTARNDTVSEPPGAEPVHAEFGCETTENDDRVVYRQR